MNEHTTERETEGREGQTATSEGQREQVSSDIVIWVHPKNAVNMVQSLKAYIQDAAFPAYHLWSGLSGGRCMGVVVIEWEGPVSPAFLANLRRDFEVVDFVAYDWVSALTYREEEPDEDIQVSNEDPLPLAHLQAGLDDLHVHLDIVTNLQKIPQTKQINALLQTCNHIKALVPALQALIGSMDDTAQERLKALADRFALLERRTVLLRQACQSREQTLDDLLQQQLEVREAGEEALRYATEAQEALQALSRSEDMKEERER